MISRSFQASSLTFKDDKHELFWDEKNVWKIVVANSADLFHQVNIILLANTDTEAPEN